MNDIVKPNLVIAGVARCGTTSLYHYLKQHPDIGFPAKKEPKYFSAIHLDFPHNGPGDHTVDTGMIRSRKVYDSLFQDVGGYEVIGEASSDYFFYHNYTVDEINRELGDVDIIIMLRNPVERAYSAYNNLVRDGREKLDFKEALQAEGDRLSNNWDWMWAYKGGSLYADGLAHFISTFSRVKVILFDDFEDSPDMCVREIFRFLGVDDTVPVNTSTKYSHSGAPKNRLVRYLTNRDNKLAYGLRTLAMRLVPRSMLEAVAERALEKDPIADDVKAELITYFHDDIERTEKLISRDLSHWKQT